MSTCWGGSSLQTRRVGAGGPSSGMSGRRIGHRAQWLTSGCCSSVASLWKRGVHFISEDKGQQARGKGPGIILYPHLAFLASVLGYRLYQRFSSPHVQFQLAASMGAGTVYLPLAMMAVYPSLNDKLFLSV